MDLSQVDLTVPPLIQFLLVLMGAVFAGVTIAIGVQYLHPSENPSQVEPAREDEVESEEDDDYDPD